MTNFTYSTNARGQIIRSDGAQIPLDARNSDYMAYQDWVAAGNVVAAYNGAPLAVTAFIAQVQVALNETDRTMARIGEAVSLGLNTWNGADVVAWVNYRHALRALLSSSTVGSLPEKPAYPAGT